MLGPMARTSPITTSTIQTVVQNLNGPISHAQVVTCSNKHIVSFAGSHGSFETFQKQSLDRQNSQKHLIAQGQNIAQISPRSGGYPHMLGQSNNSNVINQEIKTLSPGIMRKRSKSKSLVKKRVRHVHPQMQQNNNQMFQNSQSYSNPAEYQYQQVQNHQQNMDNQQNQHSKHNQPQQVYQNLQLNQHIPSGRQSNNMQLPISSNNIQNSIPQLQLGSSIIHQH